MYYYYFIFMINVRNDSGNEDIIVCYSEYYYC